MNEQLYDRRWWALGILCLSLIVIGLVSLFFLPARPPSRAEAETEIEAGELVSAGPPARSKGVR